MRRLWKTHLARTILQSVRQKDLRRDCGKNEPSASKSSRPKKERRLFQGSMAEQRVKKRRFRETPSTSLSPLSRAFSSHIAKHAKRTGGAVALPVLLRKQRLSQFMAYPRFARDSEPLSAKAQSGSSMPRDFVVRQERWREVVAELRRATSDAA